MSGKAAADLAHAAVVVRVRVRDEGGRQLLPAVLDEGGELARLVDHELHVDQDRVPLPADEGAVRRQGRSEPAMTSKRNPPRSSEKMVVSMRFLRDEVRGFALCLACSPGVPPR